jgi:hypothetical protein
MCSCKQLSQQDLHGCTYKQAAGQEESAMAIKRQFLLHLR